VQGRGALRRELTACLRTGRALRVPRARTRGRGKKFVTPEIMISQRPAEAADRAVPGHWEGDLIVGLNSSAIGTLVERTTRFTMLLHLPPMKGHGTIPRAKNGPALAGHGAEAVRDAIAATITTLPAQLRRSLTWDQGAEMASHARLRIRQDRSLAGKAEEHDRRGQKSGSRRACRKPWHQIRQRAEQTRRHSTWDSPPAPTWPPGPGAPRWTTPPANARGKPSPRRATGTWPPSPGRPPSRSARPRPAKAPATGGYPAAAAKPKLRSPWATPSSRSTTRCCLTPAPGYQDLGPGYHERQRDTRRQIAHRVGKLGALGFEATLCRIPDPNPTRRRPGRLTRQPTPADGGGSTATAD
jgi:hypothetical protein